MRNWWVSWKLSICVAVSWDALVPRARAAPKAMPDGEIYIRPGRAEQLLFHTRALLVSQTRPCKLPAETELFCRTSHALAEGGGGSSSASLQFKNYIFWHWLPVADWFVVQQDLFCGISQQTMFISNTARDQGSKDVPVNHRNHDTGETFLISDLTIFIIYLNVIVS